MTVLSKKIAVGFVIYNEGSEFVAKLELLAKNNLQIYLFDNSPGINRTNNYVDIEKATIHYASFGRNVGLGIGMSEICSEAFNHGFKYLLFFDQDTVFTKQTLDFASKLIEKETLKEYSALSFANAAPSFKKDSKPVRQDGYHEMVSTNLIRNSGSIFILDSLKEMKWFNKEFFVDGVDYEFSLRSSIHNYKLATVNPVPGFDHETEQGNQSYTILGKNFVGRNYPKSRIIDVIVSSLRIIFSGLYHLKIGFVFLVFKHSILFLVKQLLIRMFKVND